MGECGKCGGSVRVPDGYEFNEDDLCWECMDAELTRLREQVALAAKREAVLRDGLESMKRSTHEECEDPWYSCPKSNDGCLDENKGTDCTCGTDHWNERINATLARADAIKEEKHAD